ncbi:MAG: N-acetylneuraminate synthase family protein, partial [Planctomycetota bacterium]
AALERFDPPAYKIAAPEICDLPLLRTVAATGKPVLLSTGLASLTDLATAVALLERHGAGGIVLLKCSTAYPAPEDEINLRTIPNLAETFACPAGFSDHTLGIGVALAAIGLGARVIEKHFTLDDEDTVDGFFSLQVDALAAMITEIHRAERALGRVDHSLTPGARANAQGRRSLYVSAPIAAGETLTPENIRSVRPGHGLDTRYYDIVLGRTAACDLEEGDRLSWDVVG